MVKQKGGTGVPFITLPRKVSLNKGFPAFPAFPKGLHFVLQHKLENAFYFLDASRKIKSASYPCPPRPSA